MPRFKITRSYSLLPRQLLTCHPTDFTMFWNNWPPGPTSHHIHNTAKLMNYHMFHVTLNISIFSPLLSCHVINALTQHHVSSNGRKRPQKVGGLGSTWIQGVGTGRVVVMLKWSPRGDRYFTDKVRKGGDMSKRWDHPWHQDDDVSSCGWALSFFFFF